MALPFVSMAAGAIGTVLLSIVGHVVGRVLVSLGFGYVTYVGIDALMGWVQGQLSAQLAVFPPNLGAVLGLLKVQPILNMYLAAYAASWLPAVLGAPAYTKLVMKQPGA